MGNLPWSVTDEDLTAWFNEVGPVSMVRIAEDYETGKRKGFAHVEFVSPADATKAVEFNGQELNGRALRIDVSAPRARVPLPPRACRPFPCKFHHPFQQRSSLHLVWHDACLCLLNGLHPASRQVACMPVMELGMREPTVGKEGLGSGSKWPCTPLVA